MTAESLKVIKMIKNGFFEVVMMLTEKQKAQYKILKIYEYENVNVSDPVWILDGYGLTDVLELSDWGGLPVLVREFVLDFFLKKQ